MRDWVVARRYARAAYKLSHARGAVEGVRAELADFASLFRANEEFRRFLERPDIPPAAKQDVIAKAVADETAREFLRFLVERGRMALVPAVFVEFQKEYRRDEGIVAAEITAAAPVPEDIVERLAAALARMTGKRPEFTAVVDESVIGGVKLRLGDHVIDGTLAARLGQIREAMAGTAAAGRGRGSRL
jgi:F-type H+-transporting ATPase subunit delta